MQFASESLQIVCAGLEMADDDASFHDEMRPELLALMIAFDHADWTLLAMYWRSQPLVWCKRLCDTLSPVKHGRPATDILLAMVHDGPMECMEMAATKLVAHQALSHEEYQALRLILDMRSPLIPANHFDAPTQHFLRLRIPFASESPRLSEACEFSRNHRMLLTKSLMAACYYCQTQFKATSVSEFIDKGMTALCPFCGIDAVLPEDSNFDLDPADLQALNEFWFF